MNRIRKATDPADNWEWRPSQHAPGGEWVDSSAPTQDVLRRAPARKAITELPEVSTGGWLVSSFDLLSGMDVVDDGMDSVPADIFDELFPRRRGAGTAPD